MFVIRILVVIDDKWQEVALLVAYCLGLFLPFLLWPKSSATFGQFVSLLEMNFYTLWQTLSLYVHFFIIQIYSHSENTSQINFVQIKFKVHFLFSY